MTPAPAHPGPRAPQGAPAAGLGWHAVELLLHRAPLLLLDTVEEVTPDHCRTRLTVDPGAWYAQADGAMPAWFGLELMAQTIATYSGHRQKRVNHPLCLGYLLGTANYESVLPAFPAGMVLETEAMLQFWDELTLSAFRCEISHRGQPLASATLKVLEEL